MVTRFFMIFLAAVFLAGCGRAEITDVERNPDGGVDITAELSESDVNAAIQSALAANTNPLLRNPRVDLQAGQVIVYGEHVAQGAGDLAGTTVSGSITFTPSVQNGALALTVTDMQLEGIDSSDERVTAFNARLATALTNRANRENRQISVISVTVSDDSLQVVFNARR